MGKQVQLEGGERREEGREGGVAKCGVWGGAGALGSRYRAPGWVSAAWAWLCLILGKSPPHIWQRGFF